MQVSNPLEVLIIAAAALGAMFYASVAFSRLLWLGKIVDGVSRIVRAWPFWARLALTAALIVALLGPLQVLQGVIIGTVMIFAWNWWRITSVANRSEDRGEDEG